MAARRSVVIALLAALLTSVPAQADAATWPPHPDDDPFYAQPLRDYVTVPELLDVPAVQDVIAENTMGRQLPYAPTYIYQGTHDELAITPPVDTLVRTYCGMGATVQYVKIPGEHITTAVTGVPGALAYVQNRLNGRPAPSSC